MRIKPTIGPWHGKGTPLTEECTVWSGERHIVAIVPAHYDDTGRLSGTHCADARLIAAAPDLYDACKAIAALVDEHGRMNLIEVSGMARAAIAKAEGG